MHLIINADDFGISEDANLAIDYCFSRNIIQRTTIMVNMDNFDSAVALSKKHGYVDKVGLHLNIVEGTPLTEQIKNTVFCTNGLFNGQALRNRKNRFLLSKQDKIAVEQELRAQIEKYIEYGFTLLHIDSHQHSHTNPSIINLLLPLMKEYGCISLRLSRNIPECEIVWMKKIYKKIFNAKVRKFNQCGQHSQWYVDYFGSQSDVDKILMDTNYQNSSIEVEVHPTIDSNGKLNDLLYPVCVEDWIEYISRHYVEV